MPPTDQASASGELAALIAARDWAGRNTHQGTDFAPERIAELKRRADVTVSVVIPAKSVEPTIGDVVSGAVSLRECGAIDQVLVIDAGAADDRGGEIAADAGAEVHREDELLPQFGTVRGKGDALWRSQSVASGDLIVFVDGDTADFDPAYICGLAGPLLVDPNVMLVKGAYRRPFNDSGISVSDGGGRVSELAARPLLNLFFPELAAVHQPLAGEFATRRHELAGLPFATGYGVEIQLLIDFYRRFGLDAIAQTNLGQRINQHQSLPQLGPMAFTVMRALLERADGVELDAARRSEYLSYSDGKPALAAVPLALRPPYGEVANERAADGA